MQGLILLIMGKYIRKYKVMKFLKYMILALIAFNVSNINASDGNSKQPQEQSNSNSPQEDDKLPPSVEYMVKALEKEQQIKPMKEYKELFPSKSLNARKVIFGYQGPEGDSCDIAIKVFKNLELYTKELEYISRDQKYIAEFNKLKQSCDTNLPIIVDTLGTTIIKNIRGEYEGVTVLEMAKGKTIKDIIENILDYKGPQITKIFRTIGSQLGALDVLFYNESKKLFLHPDSHWENFIYDEEDQQLYWIDTSGITTTDLVEGQETPRLFWTSFMKDIGYRFIGTLREDMSRLVHEIKTNPSDDNYLKLIKYFLVIKSLFQGYLSEMTSKHLKKEVKNNYKIFFETKERFKLPNGKLSKKKSLIQMIKKIQSSANEKKYEFNPTIVKSFGSILNNYPSLKKKNK